MKKFIVFIFLVFLITGCKGSTEKNIIKNLDKKISSSSSYKLDGKLEIYRNEEIYTYDIESSYEKGEKYMVKLVNRNNNHEQIILKNEEGIYVLTPSLNKSFKFQSDWPNNNSQIYLLQPILNDIKSDSKALVEKNEKNYIINSKVNYSTEKDFVKQKVYVDSKNNVTKIEILDAKDNVKMSMEIIDLQYNTKFDDNYFDVNSYISTNSNENTLEENNKSEVTDSSSLKIDEIVYPMYIPTDTFLSSQNVVETDDGERAILTFSGESSFTVVQETLHNDDTLQYVYGDPYLILDTIGSITDSSVSWISNGIEYSVVSENLDSEELLTVAQSITVQSVGK